MDKNTDVGAINSKAQLDRITQLMQAGVPRARAVDLVVPLPDAASSRPDDLHRRDAVDADRPRGDLRPGADHA
jgi:hypothetical protein